MLMKKTEHNNSIDAVITWVDGNDPAHRAKMEKYLPTNAPKKSFSHHATRFASNGEIKYCLLSILTFAPFVRKIFIVTDNQNPELDEIIAQYFPERKQDVILVDHKEIFRGYETYLPTFNSSTIENMLWRIPGLSEQFVFFNDDMFLIRQISKEDWFKDNDMVVRGNWLPSAALRHGWRKIRSMIDKTYTPRPSHNIKQWLSADLIGFKWSYFGTEHTPLALKKSYLENFYAKNPKLLISNISHKFRHHTQFNVAAIAVHTSLRNGNKNIAKPEIAYLQPSKRMAGYLAKKLEKADKDPQTKFLCVQNLDQCSTEDQELLWNWMNKRLKLQPA